MATKYKLGLTIIGIFLTLSLLVLISYTKYQKDIENKGPLVLVENGLSINFLNGNKIQLNNETKTYTFSITNNSSEKMVYSIFLENSIYYENVNYELNEKNSRLSTIKNALNEEGNLAEMIAIESKETHSYTLTFSAADSDFSSTLKIGIEECVEEYFANTIKEDNTIKSSSLTETGVEIAKEDEGLIEANDDTGTFYYFRGNVSNNYVLFADLVWRIVRINSDGSVKIILDDYTGTTGNFYNSNGEDTIQDKINFSKNNMYTLLKEWYQKNLEDYDENLISTRYCVDDSISNTEDTTNYYSGNSRILNELNIVYNCLGTNYTSRIGLLSADEILLAGATANEANTDYYLYLPNKTVSWWTLTPSLSDKNNITYFEVDSTGKIASQSIGSYYRSIRPVVNLIKRTSVIGSGTETDPYTLKS